MRFDAAELKAAKFATHLIQRDSLATLNNLEDAHVAEASGRLNWRIVEEIR